MAITVRTAILATYNIWQKDAYKGCIDSNWHVSRQKIRIWVQGIIKEKSEFEFKFTWPETCDHPTLLFKFYTTRIGSVEEKMDLSNGEETLKKFLIMKGFK